ncbi:Terpene cyclase atmB [Aspergillus parasiticus]
MDGFGSSQAPAAYREVEWIADVFVIGMGIGWVINYVGMVYGSLKGRTYGMAIMPLCCNIAWEIVYGLIYPSKTVYEQGVFISGLTINLGVIYTAIKFGPKEWTHAPLVMHNLPLIFMLGTFGFLTGHLALAAEIGPALAYNWGAAFCQLLLSVGGLCQLITRGNTRGASYTLWLSRFLGSFSVVISAWLRYKYWPQAFSWLGKPLILWCLFAWLVVDGSYGVCFYYVKRYERRIGYDADRKTV